jgi:three-Cys-motif partner protein
MPDYTHDQYSDYKRALCLLDPYGLHLDWEVMQIAGQLKTVDLFLNFPIMVINRNVLRHDRTRVASEDIERMNRFWGDKWRHTEHLRHLH